VKDFWKVCAYANFYAAKTPGVDLSDITLTFVGSRHPRTLLHYLTSTRGYAVEETSPGIYPVSGDYIPIQIIESKKLSRDENLWLKSLRDDLKIDDARTILQERQKKESSLDAYMDILLRGNPETFLEVQNMARKPTFEEVFTKAGIIPEWLERGRKQGREEGKEIIARNLMRRGMSVEEIAQVAELPVEKIRAL
jgi:hypothetical protein